MNSSVHAIITLDSGDSDVWGWAMGHRFTIADTLALRGEWVPAEWEYRPGLGLGESEDWPDSEYLASFDAGEFDADDLRHAGNVLMRYTDLCRAQGLDY